jgi:beta-xylosidase
VNCYSSTNLVEWKYEGALLTRQGSGDLGPNRVVERPKVIYNTNSKQYVLYMHIDSSDYGEAKVGVATGNSVCGQYSYRGSWRPLGFESRDMGLFKDDDGTAYLLTEDVSCPPFSGVDSRWGKGSLRHRQRKNGLRIDKLSSDYLNVTAPTYLWKDSIEAPAMIKKNGVYFMFGSHLTGTSFAPLFLLTCAGPC